MQLQFKNEYIYFALNDLWYNPALDYKFKTHIDELVNTNSDDDFEQKVEITDETLLQIFISVSSLPEGVAAIINQDMLELLYPQLQAQSNNDQDNPNDAMKALMGIEKIGIDNNTAKEATIQKGKNKILKL